MKVCPHCHRLFDDARFCPADGKGLESVEDVELPADPDDPRIGGLLCNDRYQVWRKVADGGMGRVYEGLDTQEQRNVALKVLHADVADDEVAVERFKREFSLSAQLPHDHIVEVWDFEQTEDHSYALVMEYLEGEELRMFLKREKTLSFARIIRMLSQLAIGLEEPHKLKQVHRDIKPDNIFLCGTEDGDVVKLLDFGSVRDNSEGAKKLTVIGTTIGSPFYMSPEQAQGLPGLDHRADVWSLAAIAYECMTGKVPFYASTGPAILLAILSHEPTPPSISGEENNVPPTVDDVIADALAKDPDSRIDTVGELAQRFGVAFGLAGSHVDWAHMPQQELNSAIDEALPALMAAPRPPKLEPEPEDDAPPPEDFTEDEVFAMGVPHGPPLGLYIALGVIALAVVAGLLVFLL